MKKTSNVLWGIVLILIGIVIALNVLNIAKIDIFFEGWWTLFIIVPSFIGLFSEHEKVGNIIGILIGVVLLLCVRDVLDFSFVWKLIVPAIIVIIGIKLIVNGLRQNKGKEVLDQLKESGEVKSINAIFSGSDAEYKDELFKGAQVNAVFGGVKLDLRGALIEGDCVLDISAVFGGVDVFTDDNINIKINSNSIFGGVSNKKENKSKDNPYTLYINANCLFGGVDVK